MRRGKISCRRRERRGLEVTLATFWIEVLDIHSPKIAHSSPRDGDRQSQRSSAAKNDALRTNEKQSGRVHFTHTRSYNKLKYRNFPSTPS
jgi:hypothetical protein